jgi:excisionase family DNA binding protein
MKHEINELSVYTAEETQSILSISRSTFMRLVKKEVLRANKIGGQYRVLGRELLRLLLPAEDYNKIKSFVKKSDKVKS